MTTNIAGNSIIKHVEYEKTAAAFAENIGVELAEFVELAEEIVAELAVVIEFELVEFELEFVEVVWFAELAEYVGLMEFVKFVELAEFAGLMEFAKFAEFVEFEGIVEFVKPVLAAELVEQVVDFE